MLAQVLSQTHMGSRTHNDFLKLVHHSVFFRNFLVNKVYSISAITRDLRAHPKDLQFLHIPIFVNKSVDMNSLSDLIFLIKCSQFIERTELDDGSQQIEVEPLKDNPR
jgi:hypothetical protein